MDGKPHSFIFSSFPKCIGHSSFVSRIAYVSRAVVAYVEETHLNIHQ